MIMSVSIQSIVPDIPLNPPTSKPLNSSTPIHVAVGVIINSSNEVLVSLRHPDSHQGGLWEFPGGKREAGEDIRSALERELFEELGIRPESCFPFKRISHQYSDKSVLLDVFRITSFQGEVAGREGQAVEWRAIDKLFPEDFPVANVPIIRALQLPREIAITPFFATSAELMQSLEHLIASNVALIQLRLPQLEKKQYFECYEQVSARCAKEKVKVMINAQHSLLQEIELQDIELDGYHANSENLSLLNSRPVSVSQLFSASCHNLEQLHKADALGADFVYLSPVRINSKYPQDAELGWEGFQDLASQISLPVYALGGITHSDASLVSLSGGYGWAGIRAFADSSHF